MTSLKNRLEKLENRFGLGGAPIFTYRMEPQHWARIRLNRDIDVILFHPDKKDHDRIERLAEIEQLKKSVRSLTLISQGDGYAVWENGQCIEDGGLGHEQKY